MGTFNLDVKCWSKKQRRWILVETRIWCCLTHRPPRVLSPWQQSCVQQQMTSEEWGPDLGGTGGGSYPAPPPLASHSGPQLQLQAWGLTPWGKTHFYITVLHHSSTSQFYITQLCVHTCWHHPTQVLLAVTWRELSSFWTTPWTEPAVWPHRSRSDLETEKRRTIRTTAEPTQGQCSQRRRRWEGPRRKS